MSRTNHNRKPKGKKLKALKGMISLAGTTRPCFNQIDISSTFYFALEPNNAKACKKIAKFIIEENLDVIGNVFLDVDYYKLDFYKRNSKENKKKFKYLERLLNSYILKDFNGNDWDNFFN